MTNTSPVAVSRDPLWRGLQVVSATSWLLFAHLGLSWMMSDCMLLTPAVDQFADNVCFFALPVLTLFACLSFFFASKATRAWVWPSNIVFLILSIIPSTISAWVIVAFCATHLHQ